MPDVSTMVGLPVQYTGSNSQNDVNMCGLWPLPSSGNAQTNYDNYNTSPSCYVVAITANTSMKLISWHTNSDGICWFHFDLSNGLLQEYVAPPSNWDTTCWCNWIDFEFADMLGNDITVGTPNGGGWVQYKGATTFFGLFGGSGGSGVLPFGGAWGNMPSWLQSIFGWLAWLVYIVFAIIIYKLINWLLPKKRRGYRHG